MVTIQRSDRGPVSIGRAECYDLGHNGFMSNCLSELHLIRDRRRDAVTAPRDEPPRKFEDTRLL